MINGFRYEVRGVQSKSVFNHYKRFDAACKAAVDDQKKFLLDNEVFDTQEQKVVFSTKESL